MIFSCLLHFSSLSDGRRFLCEFNKHLQQGKGMAEEGRAGERERGRSALNSYGKLFKLVNWLELSVVSFTVACCIQRGRETGKFRRLK